MASDNPLTKRLQQWKKDQGIISLTFDELKEKVRGKFIAEQKVDGQSALLDYRDGKGRFGSLSGVIIENLPVLAEIESHLKKNKISQAVMVGELAGMENGKMMKFDDTESLIKNPAKEKSNLHWFPYQILELNGEKFGEGFDIYMEGWEKLKKLFTGMAHVHPVEDFVTDLNKVWKRVVEKEGNEGLVVRTEDGKVFKAKPSFHYDLVIVAVGSKKGKNWPKKMIGTTLMAFMDENKVFRVAGEIGTGWSHEESRELYSWAQKNKVDEDDTYVWVKPERIMQVEWERSNIRENLALKFDKGNYEKVGKLPVGTIVKPRFIRYRKDKKVNPSDLRLTQIPNWEKIKKMAFRIACRVGVFHAQS